MNDLPHTAGSDARSDACAFDKRLRRQVSGRRRTYFVVTVPGFEEICRRELAGVLPDAGEVAIQPGGVSFNGRLVDCLKANLHLRTATRVLMRIDTFDATNPRLLEKRSGAIAWELYLPAGTLPTIKVSSHRSRLYHSAAITQAIQAGILSRGTGTCAAPPGGFPQTLFVRALEDRFTLSLDSSGAPLYKRGLKSGPARAPIRETLAAAVLLTAGYDPRFPLVDPMCGSGTFSLEAAMLTRHMAPGIRRGFAFMEWPAFNENQWTFLKHEAEAAEAKVAQPRIFASDIDDPVCRRLTAAVADNGLDDAVIIGRKDFFDCTAGQYGDGPGLVVINPPYGVRIGTVRQAGMMFREIGRHLARSFGGWRVALIACRPELVRQLPFRVRSMPLHHGGLTLTLAIGDIGRATRSPRRPRAIG